MQFRIVLVSTLFSAALALFTALFSYSYFTRSLRQTQNESARSSLQVVGADLDLAFEQVTNFAEWTQLDASVASYLQHMSKVAEKDYSTRDRQLTLTVWELVSQEYNITAESSDIQRVVIMTRDGRWYLQRMDGRSHPSYINVRDDIMHADWFHELAGESTCIWRLVPSPYPDESGQYFFPVVRPIQSTSSAEIVGFCYMEVSPDMVSRILEEIPLENDAALYLTLNASPTGDSISYSFSQGVLTQSELPEGLVSYHLPHTGFTLSMKPSSALYRSQSRRYLGITVLIFLSVLLAGFIMSVMLRRLISEPVNALLLKAGRVGNGDFNRDPDIEWSNEFGDIGRSLNDLSENVSALMDRKVKDEKQKQALEYEILQSQINPHFLYNTLNTIKWMATIQGSDGIAEMSTALSRLLRNIAKSTKKLITVREELSLVQDYFTIMKYRYGGTISLEIQIDRDEINDLLINRFSLQPIVENAIFHGIEPKGSAGTIIIHAFLHDSVLQIDVADNGIGMDEETCRKVLCSEEQGGSDFFRHVGISNVNQRLHYTFGEPYGLSIHSTPGEGTVVTMTIPIQRNDTE